MKNFAFSFFCFFLCFGFFLLGTSFQNLSFNKQSLPPTSNKKTFFVPLTEFFKFQGSSANDLYNYATDKQKEQINEGFNRIKDNYQTIIFSWEILFPQISSFCNDNLLKKIVNSANLLVFLQTPCSKEVVTKLATENKINFLLQKISTLFSFQFDSLKLTKERKAKMREYLEQIKSQLIWKFLKNKDWNSFENTNSRWKNFKFLNFNNQKNLKFKQLSSLQKQEIVKLLKKIKELNIESNWQTVLDQELFSKKMNSSQSGLFIGLGVGGGVLLLIAILAGSYFYKKYKVKQKNV